MDNSTNLDNNSMLHMLDLPLNGVFLSLDDWVGLLPLYGVQAVCKKICHVKKCAQCYPLHILFEALQKSSLTRVASKNIFSLFSQITVVDQLVKTKIR